MIDVRTWRVWRASIGLLVLFAGVAGLVQGQVTATPPQVYQVKIEGMINPGAAGLLQHAVDVAEKNQAAALVVQLDTPGGLLSSTRDMVSMIAQSEVPVIGYVGPSGASATSAGAFILLSAHVAVMNTGTNVGASSPVAGDGGDIGGTLGKKVMSDSRAFMRSIATSRGRNADVAERFVSEAESLTAVEALEAGVIDGVVPAPAALLDTLHERQVQLQGRQISLDVKHAEVSTVQPRLIDKLLALVAQPQVAHLLITLGMLAIYVEILSPGLALPGVLGVIAVILGLIGVQSLPVNLGFLMLLFLGSALLIAELFIAGFGVLGIGGAVAFVLGSFFLFDMPFAAEHRNVMVAVSVAVSAVMVLTSLLITRTFRGKQQPPSLVGKGGEAMVSFERAGHVLIDDRPWPADTTEPLAHGDSVVVLEMLPGGRVLVKKHRHDS